MDLILPEAPATGENHDEGNLYKNERIPGYTSANPVYLNISCKDVSTVVNKNLGSTDENVLGNWNYPITYSPQRSTEYKNGYTKNPEMKVDGYKFEIKSTDEYTIDKVYTAVIPGISRTLTPEIHI